MDKRPLKVFLCHASADKPKVRELYRTLKRRGVQPWLEKENPKHSIENMSRVFVNNEKGSINNLLLWVSSTWALSSQKEVPNG